MRTLCGAILLSGGIGSRMSTAGKGPKQYLELNGKPIIQYSFEKLICSEYIDEIVIVCEEAYRHHFKTDSTKPVLFALPGARRQDSVYNGLKALSTHHPLVLIHDGARPFLTDAIIERTIEAAEAVGAATAAMPLKFTVKVADREGMVISTPDRESLWEIQTPQVVRRTILENGFKTAIDSGQTVTDDVSLAEIVGAPVKLVEGSYNNIKITVPADLLLANQIIQQLCHSTTN